VQDAAKVQAEFRIKQIAKCMYLHSIRMKKSELTPPEYPPSSVLPHVDRRFAAIEAAERKSGSIVIPDI